MGRAYTINYLEECMDTNTEFFMEPGKWVKRNENFVIECMEEYDSVLSRLIQEAGRFCDWHSSQLFDDWEKIRELVKNPDYRGDKYPFGFYNYGVDTGDKVLDSLSCYGRFYYRSVWLLGIDVRENKIRMWLIKICL